MKCAFFFDTILLSQDNDYYGMTLTYDFFKKRYLTMFDEMIISTRCKKIKNEKGNHAGYKIVNGDKVQVIPIKSYNNIPDAIKNSKKIKLEISKVVEMADKVIIRMPSVIGIFACNICRKMNKPYLIEMVACPWDGYRNHTNRMGKIIAPFMWYYTKKYVKNAPNVLYVTNEFLQRRYPTKGKSCACSDVVLKQFDDTILRNRINKIEKLKDVNNIKLCTVANVGMKYKGHEYVIKAMAELRKKGKILEYYLVGNGDNSRLQSIAQKYNVEDQIVFVGSLPHDEIFDFLDKIDLYIQPSLQEGLPRALLEAMSKACPCVGSDVGGIPELLNKKFIFKRRNIKALVEILDNLSIDEMIRSAKENFKIIKEYSVTKLERKRKDFYMNN